MTYEVQFQHEGAEYTVRGPDIDGVLRLIQGARGVGRVPEWIDWAGGDRPVPVDAKVEVQFRGGGRATGAAGQFAWLHDDHSSDDIVKYRVCE